MKASDTLEELVPARVFKEEVVTWARRIGVEPQETRIRPMKTKWASCSSNGRLTFNSEILSQPAHFRAEAIVHELLHLKVPNHGKLFKELMKALLAQEQPSCREQHQRAPYESGCVLPDRRI